MPRPSARDRILDCAESLFAEHGLGGTSLRAINAEAGLSPAALHYHFGSQQAVVEALLERRMPALMERRKQLLDALDARAEAPSTREVMNALVAPLAELLAEGGEHGLGYLRFVHRLNADGDLDAAFVLEHWPGGVERIAPLLERALPGLPRPLLEFRMAHAIDTMLRSLAHGPTPASGDLASHVGALLDFLTGALEAPITGDTP